MKRKDALLSLLCVAGGLLALPAIVAGILALVLWGDAGNWPWIVAVVAFAAFCAGRKNPRP